jgi:phage/plasmid-like protein (TIGR03299 family)
MSRETLETLNLSTLIGFTSKRGNAWHYREELQGSQSNHYDGAIPVADVTHRLFNFTAEARAVYVAMPADLLTADALDEAGNPIRYVRINDRQAITHSATGDVFNLFTSGYTIHQFGEWLIDTVSPLLSDTITIGSAGVLRQGAVAWVSVEAPENQRTREGVVFRPNLLAATSHDGSMATTYKMVATNVVCDNTMSAALRERGPQYKVKHSRHSTMRLQDARDALGLLEITADNFAAEVQALCQQSVTNAQWSAFLTATTPIPSTPGRAQTLAATKQDTLRRLWNDDPRVSPWAGTAYGVLQAVNTYTHHEQTVRGAGRAERNMLRAVTGGVDELDRTTLATLERVLTA